MGRKGQGSGSNKRSPTTTDTKRSGLSSKNNNKVLIGQLVDKLLKEVSVAIPPEEPWNVYCTVYNILQEISKLEGKEVGEKQDERKPEVIAEFVVWLKDCGVDCRGVKIQEFPGFGLGVKACKNYKAGDLVMRVPRKVMMSEERARMSPMGVLIDKDPLLNQMPHVTLAMFLLLQKYTPDSYWKPYINILPPSYTTILYFTPDDFQYLKGSAVYQTALMLYLAIARQYGYFYKFIHLSPHQASQVLKEHFTFDEYRWAVSTVMTRQNRIPGVGDGELDSTEEPPLILALIPLWDMCNHVQGEITTGFNRDADEAECFALKDFKKNEQILIFYGDRNNAYFFLYNGFVYEDNHHDSMMINLGVSRGDPLCEDRKKVLQRVGITGNFFNLHGAPLPCLSGEVIAMSRVMSMKKEHLTMCLESETPKKLLEESSLPGLEEVEKAAYSYINTRCKLLLLPYTKSLEAAEQAMKELSVEEKGSSKHRSLIDQLKKCEMNILQRVVEHTDLKIECLTGV